MAGILEPFLTGRCLAVTLSHGRPLAVTVLAVELVAFSPPQFALVLAGGRQAHEFAAERRAVTINLLNEEDGEIARRYGRVTCAAGWDELLGIQLRFRRGGVPGLARATAWLNATVQLPSPASMDWLLATITAADGSSCAARS